MLLSDLRNVVASGIGMVKEAFFLTEDKALESLPEPYIPLYETLTEMPEKLREKALGTSGSANPSQLGDPISLKAEQSDTIPTPDESGNGSASYSTDSRSNNRTIRGSTGKKMIRERAVQLVHGPNANPSQLGDPVSMTAEQTSNGPKRRDSKL